MTSLGDTWDLIQALIDTMDSVDQACLAAAAAYRFHKACLAAGMTREAAHDKLIEGMDLCAAIEDQPDEKIQNVLKRMLN